MIKKRINLLRKLFANYNITGYIVPSNDEYMNEYVPSSAKRLEYITNFTGSSGLVVICENTALFFTDGRYLEQSAKELDKEVFQIFDIKNISKFPWRDYFSTNVKLGYDPSLFTLSSIKNFPVSLQKINENLIDKIWDEQPKQPASEVYLQDIRYAGISHREKIAKCREVLTKYSADAIVITAPDSICWLLNLRANDVSYSPLMLARVLLTNAQLYLFIDQVRVGKEITQNRPEITLLAKEQFKSILQLSKRILIDETTASIHIMDLISNKIVEKIADPCQILKACKNHIEIQHSIDFHVKDAVALCEFFSYINTLKLEEQTEYSLGEILTKFRAQQEGYVSDSFPTICGFKENSAIIHYKADQSTAKKIIGSGILLIDSGAQYKGCTTDITRTIAIGEPTEEQKKYYTQVLKGHIALSNIKFPKDSITGANLDVLARQYLWQEHLDYPHGTGHGVGSFLNVHEGPQSINLRNQVVLQAGMILSNEPGYYIPRKFGIRIENLMYIKENKEWLEFQALSLVPYDKKLINFDMLDKGEIEYLKNYYYVIKSKVWPLLSSSAQIWLDLNLE